MTVPEIAEDITSRFDYLLVDEYQDVNRLQAQILSHLKPDGRGVTAVGDDWQAIYGFRGADVRNILNFPMQYQPPADVVALERNYRSTVPILDASNAVIGEAAEGYRKRLWSDRKSNQRPLLVTVLDGVYEARYVVERVLANRGRGLTLKEQAVLFRASHQSAQLEAELTHRGIPYVHYGSQRFLDSAHVKDLLAVLRFASNPKDSMAGFRIIQLIPGIGLKAVGQLLKAVRTSLTPFIVLDEFSPRPGATVVWRDFLTLLVQLRSTLAGWPAEIDAIRQWYDPLLELWYEEPRVRVADLDRLAQIAATFVSREEFLTELMLDPPEFTADRADTDSDENDRLVLSTIHSAKGLEWSTVFILDAIEGCIPSGFAMEVPAWLEEERRLMYVAMTRAREELHIVQPRRLVTDEPGPGKRSVRTRFIPSELLGLFEQRSWPKVEDFGMPNRSISSQDATISHVRNSGR